MQRSKKLCAFLIALCLVVGLIPASVFAAESKTEVVGQQLYLGDDLTMHFYVSISDTHKTDGVMNVSVGSSSVDHQIQTMTANDDGNYVFSVELGAPQMTDDITLTLTSGGEQVLQKVYSVQDYAHYLLENNYTSETKALVKEMLNYGTKAQLYFDHNTTDLANAGYVIETTGVIDTAAPEVAVSGAVDGIAFYGCSMVFESKIAIRYYFSAPNGVAGYTFTVDGNKVEPQYKSNMYYIEVDGIAPDAMDTLRTVAVAKDDAALSVQYSPVYYITRMYNKPSTNQTLKDLLLAAKGYFDAAKVFTGVEKNTLTIDAVRNDISSAKTLYFTTNLTHGLDLYTDVTGLSNEETHILINGQTWDGQELCTFENNVFYVNFIGATEGTQLTIQKGFSITLHGESYVTEQEYNFWWFNGNWVAAKDTLEITTLGSGDATILFFHTNTTTGVADWTDIAGKCNEETHILINDQAWSTQEIGAISGKEFYVNKIGATEGTMLTIKEGFTAIFNGVAYVTDQDYNYWWTGSAWTNIEPIPETPLTIDAVQSYSNAKTLYFATDYTHGMTLYASVTGYANEETHVLVNGQAWNDGYELCAFENNVFYINNIGAAEGTSVTIKAGFTIHRNGVKYVTAQDYNFWWINGTWVTAKDTLEITTLGSGDATILFFHTTTTTGVADWTNIASKCNEETHILINDQAWSTQEIGGIAGKEFYVNKIGATEGTKLTIKAGFTAIFNGVAYTTDKDYTYWWNGTAWTDVEPILEKTLTIGAAQSYSIYRALYFATDLTHGKALYTDMTGVSNEETHILVDGQAWNGYELCTYENNVFYINKLNPVEGTTVTIQAGFTIQCNGINYVTDQDYVFTWTGARWVSEVKALTIGAAQSYSTYKALYFTTDLTHGKSLYADMTGASNEETHIFVNGQAWNGYELCAFENNVFYINNIGAAAGTHVTITEGFAIALNGTAYITQQDYNFWWTGSAWTTSKETLTINGLGAGNASILYFRINTTTGVADWTNIAGKCNEETHILINDQAWSGQELGGISGSEFYVNNIGATVGTKLTIKKGFTATFNGVLYVTDQDYNYWWNGSAWTASTETLSITGLGTGTASILYFRINTTTGVADWTNIAGKCNEETHILINDQAWSGQELGGISGSEFYTNNLNATAGTNLTIKKGFTAVFNGTVYVTERDYSFTWNGSGWTIDLPLAEKTLTVGTAQSYSTYNALYFATDYTHGMSLYANVTNYANEETHILVNDQAWNGYELCAFEGNVFYINKIGATEGTTVTIKEGFTIYKGGIVYTTEQEYSFKWNGSAWVDVSFVAPEGIWNEIPLGVFGSPYTSQAAYDECAGAGFNFALIDQNYGAIGSANYKAILNYCVQAGMNPISMTFGENDTTDYSDVPGYAGKFYFDEPGSSEFATIAAMVSDFEAQGYKNGIFLNNLLPSYASKLTMESFTYETYLDKYITQVLSKLSGPKWLSVDFYPLWENSSGATKVHANYLYNLEATAQAALAHKDMDLTVHYFVQTHGYGDSEWYVRDLQSVADIRYQYNCAMAYGVNAFSVFTYPTQTGEDFANGNGLVTINADGTTTKNEAYYYVQQANNELKAWDEIYLSYDYEGTMAIGKTTSGISLANMLNHNLTSLSGVSVSNASNDTLIGQFDKNGSKAFMVANYSDPANGEMDTVIMNFAEGTTLQVIINGVVEETTVSDGRLVLSLDAGEAAFVIVK